MSRRIVAVLTVSASDGVMDGGYCGKMTSGLLLKSMDFAVYRNQSSCFYYCYRC